MKRLPIHAKPHDDGRVLWRSLGDKAGDPALLAARGREFPPGASEPPEGVDRRTFLAVMGASMALGTASCRRPEEKILPYAKRPEDLVPGNPLFFATATSLGGSALGLLVESHEGRPTKVEGNPQHPDSFGATDTFAQASVLDLYDPDRSRQPILGGVAKTRADAEKLLADLASAARQSGGKGLAILTEGHRSPSLADALDRVRRDLPEAQVFRYEAFSNDPVRRGAEIAFGAPVETIYELAQAKVIVVLDGDPLATEGSRVKNARGFARSRATDRVGAAMSRLYVAESTMSCTGTMADHRLRIASKHVAALASAIAKSLATGGVRFESPADVAGADALPDTAKKWAAAVAKDLLANRGAGVVIAGHRQPPAIHALAQQINLLLDNVGRTVRHRPAFDVAAEGAGSILALVKAIGAGEVQTLVILGGNPVFNGPADAKLGEALKKVKTTVHLSTHFDETSRASSAHINRAHYLEAWGDVRAEDGSSSVAQPLIAPIFDGMSELELVERLLGGSRTGFQLVQSTWRAIIGMGFEAAWSTAVHDGVLPAPDGDTPVTLDHGAITAALAALPAAPAGLEVTFQPDPHAYDGRYANNGWLQEMPDGFHRLAWGNGAAISPSHAAKLGVATGDHVSVTVDGATVTLPAIVAPGQADDSIALTVGQGRTEVGVVGKGTGVDTTPLRKSGGFYVAAATIAKAAGTETLAIIQDHFSMEGRPIVREATVAGYAKDPDFAKKGEESPPLVSPFKEFSYAEGHRWGMTIDLQSCVGCSACVIACYAENNIPIVGRDGVARHREMNWIRIDRYYEGDADEPHTMVQPMLCQHCENAPCEQVCPVAATTHSPEGINEMSYNRCIGTKYCGNNCPYKVRRFNYLDYGGGDVVRKSKYDDLRQLQFNPDVTVRSRGVMEKCTWCIQRINAAKIRAKVQGRDRVLDGEILVACQQACPSGAIQFGDLNDPKSQVSQGVASKRSYMFLTWVNVKPRLSYQARIRNPNPELEQA